MRNLGTNDWVFLNDLIYQIHTTEDSTKMRYEFLERMKSVMDFDAADFYLASADDKRLLTAPVYYNYTPKHQMNPLIPDLNHQILFSGKCVVCRESDIADDAQRIETDYYRTVYQANQFHYGLQMVLAVNGRFFGVVTFYRSQGKPDFEYGDIFLLDLLKDHLAYRLYRWEMAAHAGGSRIDVEQAVESYGLTRREHTILSMLVEGQENTEISEKLSISPNTLKKHILNIYRKLGINSRVQMFRMIRQKQQM